MQMRQLLCQPGRQAGDKSQQEAQSGGKPAQLKSRCPMSAPSHQRRCRQFHGAPCVQECRNTGRTKLCMQGTDSDCVYHTPATRRCIPINTWALPHISSTRQYAYCVCKRKGESQKSHLHAIIDSVAHTLKAAGVHIHCTLHTTGTEDMVGAETWTRKPDVGCEDQKQTQPGRGRRAGTGAEQIDHNSWSLRALRDRCWGSCGSCFRSGWLEHPFIAFLYHRLQNLCRITGGHYLLPEGVKADGVLLIKVHWC